MLQGSSKVLDVAAFWYGLVQGHASIAMMEKQLSDAAWLGTGVK